MSNALLGDIEREDIIVATILAASLNPLRKSKISARRITNIIIKRVLIVVRRITKDAEYFKKKSKKYLYFLYNRT